MIDDAALYALSARYASAIDRRDADDLVSVFADRAELSGPPARNGERRVFRGRDELAEVVGTVATFRRTFHLVGTHRFWAAGDTTVHGEVYCTAHHLRVGEDGGTDLVMYLRYLDEYVEVPGGTWSIARRNIEADWSEVLPARRDSWT
jgi:SnoaL-like domain